ncbi:Glu/Leu/Phe/Val family dehydrogenase [Litchfieldella xinjiangensis]|uniref:Glu/Leu/Phe/Val family dehydrogenase n=1 Tax=Litchfieldella xinjiangensis TaxID=1166948 RepID=UPI0006947A8D|nr:Glu/Leu/Phe/Val dehydrogenase [Halomonas xinjiangensis]
MTQDRHHSSHLFDDARILLNEVLDELDTSEDVRQRLLQPNLSLQVGVHVRMDDGSLKVFPGWRTQYDTSLGPAKGGIRFHPSVDQQEVGTLSFWMAVKCAVLGLPYGGGKGGVQVDPKALSSLELERLSRGYLRAIADVIGPDRDIPAPDMNTNATIMGWMSDEYDAIQRDQIPAALTGKPIALGGSLGRVAATGRGALQVLDLWAERNERKPEDTTIAVQGFGNAAYHFARLAHQRGYRIVAISDSKGAIHHPEGLDPDPIKEEKTRNQRLKGMVYCENSVCEHKGAKTIEQEELLALDVDVLALGALENQIHVDNVESVRAGLLLEIANGPVTREADEALAKRNVPVLPDVLANAGGVVVSYYEWIQNRSGEYWEEDSVNQRLAERMTREAQRVMERAETRNIPYRRAAYLLGLERISEAILARGQCHRCE